jgi:Putative peptidoglycan binding domain/Tetratricopeptide repeat
MEEQLQQRGLSSSSLAERGVFPTDGSISSIRAGCMKAALPVSPVAAPPVTPSAIPVSPQLLSAAPTFDCVKAKSSTGRILCGDQAGAKADWDITSAYWATFFSLPLSERDAFKRRHRSRLRGDALAESTMSPEEHAQIQSRLIALGYFDESPDGEFGPLTRDAIRRFQMRSGEPVSDFLSPAQQARLANSTPLSPPSGRVPDPSLPPPVEKAPTAAEAESQCQSEDTNTRLAGCTEVISSKGRGYRVALADAYDGRCRSYNDLGRYQQAADDCNAAIKLNSNHPYAFNNLAAALDGLGDPERSISAYSRAIALKPSFIYSYLGRAHIFIKIGDKMISIRH